MPKFQLAIALAIGLTCLLSATATLANGSARQQPVRTAGYSTTSQSAKLKWLPHRPVKVTADRRAVASRRVRTVAQRTGNVQNSASSPFNSPFGGAKQKRQPAAAADILTTPPANPRKPSPQEPSQVDQPLPDLAIPEPEKPKTEQTESMPAATEAPDLAREKELAAARGVEDECPTAKDFKTIAELTYKTIAEQGEFPTECPLTKDPFEGREWAPTKFSWKASGLCHKPLYFEQVQLERYGHSWGPYLQPVICGGHFFLTVPVLPYLMGVNAPNECLYTLGYYRPGSCAPYMLDALPISVRGAIYEAGIFTGLTYAFP